MFTKINFCLHFGLIVHTLYKSMLVLPIFFRIIYIFFNVLFECHYLVVEVRRVELLTSCLQGRRSSQTELYPHIEVMIFKIKCTFLSKVH